MKCENCENVHKCDYGSGRFCSSKCARGFSTKNKREEINDKVSKKITNTKKSNIVKLKMSESMKKYWSEKKISNNKTKVSDETRNKMSLSARRRNRTKGEIVIKYCKHCKKSKEMIMYSSICNNCKGEFRVYKESCIFKFNVYNFPEKFDLDIIFEYGWYSPQNSNNPNLDGISRDHIISVSDGFKHKIPPEMIAHPANCRLMRHTENQLKFSRSDMTFHELKNKIHKWNC